jgi:hypothetical protein
MKNGIKASAYSLSLQTVLSNENSRNGLRSLEEGKGGHGGSSKTEEGLRADASGDVGGGFGRRLASAVSAGAAGSRRSVAAWSSASSGCLARREVLWCGGGELDEGVESAVALSGTEGRLDYRPGIEE